MKLNIITKALPFISTVILIFFLYISNQKVNTNLRILIWNTPSYSLGTYLAVSTGIGFLFSYILTTNLANSYRYNHKSIKYSYEKNKEDSSKYKDYYFRVSEEKTLIERDINDPSPTINAQFRVIGKTERYNTNNIDTRIKYDKGNDYDQSYNDLIEKNESFTEETQNCSDWNDDTFSSW